MRALNASAGMVVAKPSEEKRRSFHSSHSPAARRITSPPSNVERFPTPFPEHRGRSPQGEAEGNPLQANPRAIPSRQAKGTPLRQDRRHSPLGQVRGRSPRGQRKGSMV